MSDFPASRLNDISPAAGSEDGEMNNYVRGLFGSDMKGTKSIKRAYPETGKAQPIVRIYADPL